MGVAATRILTRRVLPYSLLTLISLFFFAPVAWILWTSLKTQLDASAIPPIWTYAPQWHNYIDAWSAGSFQHDFLNTCLLSVFTVAVTLILSVPLSYVLARLPLPGKGPIGVWLITVRMLPEMIFIIPLYTLYRTTHLYDTDLGMVLAFQIYTLPYTTWLLISFIQALPHEIEEAATVDGCSTPRLLTSVIVPLILPGLVAAGVLAFITVWTNLLFPLSLAYSNANTVSLAIANFQGYASFNWPLMTAATAISTLPQVVFFILVQRYIIRGLTLGAVKG
jgi:ABC-type glycerol-3-phosphate transport system permease component